MIVIFKEVNMVYEGKSCEYVFMGIHFPPKEAQIHLDAETGEAICRACGETFVADKEKNFQYRAYMEGKINALLTGIVT
jgi:hypothetical protein